MRSILTLALVLGLAGYVGAAETNSATTKTIATKKANANKKVVAKKKTKTNKSKLKNKKDVVQNDLQNDLSAEESALLSESSSNSSNHSQLIQQKQTAKASDLGAKKSALANWGAYAVAESYGDVKGTNDGSSDLVTDYALGVKYKLTKELSLGATSEWEQLHGFNGQESDLMLLDPSLRIAKTNLLKFNDGTAIHSQARVYLPVSDNSKEIGQISQIRLYATAVKQLTKGLSASLTLNPRIFIQENKTIKRVKDGKETISSTNNVRLLTSAGLRYDFNDKFGVEQTIGLYQKWYNGVSISNRVGGARSDFLDASTSAYYSPISNVELNFGVRQIDEATDLRSRRGRSTSNGLYAEDQIEYFLIGSISI